MPEDLPEEARGDLLAYASFRISPPGEPPTPADRDKADFILVLLKDGVDNGYETPLVYLLEQRLKERLVTSVGIPLEVRITFPRRGSIELGVLIMGAITLLKDYKPLRESLNLLAEDIKELLLNTPGGLPLNWSVRAVDFRTPGTTVAETSGGFVGMGGVSRYALLYLLIINFLVLIFFCYLTLTAVMANL